MAGQTNRESEKFALRLPDGMRERIKAEAEANNRSMNAEIVSRLQDSLDGKQTSAVMSLNIDLAEIGTPELADKLAFFVEHLRVIQAGNAIAPKRP